MTWDVIVIGVGGMGSAVAYNLGPAWPQGPGPRTAQHPERSRSIPRHQQDDSTGLRRRPTIRAHGPPFIPTLARSWANSQRAATLYHRRIDAGPNTAGLCA